MSAIAIGATVLLGACASPAPTLEESLADADDGDTGWIVDAESDVADEGNPASADAETHLDPEGTTAFFDDEVRPSETEQASTAHDETVPVALNEDYFSEIANGLLALLSDSLRDVVGGGDVYAAEAVHRAIIGPDEIERWIDALHEFFYSPEGRQTQLPPDEFGVQRFEVYELIEVSEDCMAAFGHHDVTQTSRFPFPSEEVAVLVLARSNEHDKELNPLDWLVWDSLRLYSDGEPVTIDEVSEIENLATAVDLNCSGGRS